MPSLVSGFDVPEVKRIKEKLEKAISNVLFDILCNHSLADADFKIEEVIKERKQRVFDIRINLKKK